MEMPSVTRMLSPKEIRFLRQQKSVLERRRSTLGRRAVTAYLFTLLVMLVIFGLLALWTFWGEGKNPKFIFGFWGVLGALIALSLIPNTKEERVRLSERISEYDFAISRNQCEDTAIAARKMWELEEHDDEGSCYAFELEYGGVVFVMGQEFYPSARFPNENFSIIHFRNPTHEPFEMLIEKKGKKISPERVISVKEKKGLVIPRHREFFDGTLEDVFAKLKKAPNKAPEPTTTSVMPPANERRIE
jgi:hypothetical protein